MDVTVARGFMPDGTVMIVYYSVPLILNTIGWWFNNASDRYIVTWLHSIICKGLLCFFGFFPIKNNKVVFSSYYGKYYSDYLRYDSS